MTFAPLRDRRGFTIVEVFTVMVVIGILASIALLRYIDLTNEALASKVGNEMQQVRLAAIAYFSDVNAFPPSAAAGTRPADLEPFLSGATQFTTPAYTFEWVNNADDLVGVVVRSSRAGLADKLRQRLVYGNPYIPLGDDVMYIIKAPGVSM
jgi:prepilin-type N-terminal cleavage/methylation domain-containing protein